MLIDFCLPIKNEALILESSLEKLLSYCTAAGFNFSWRIIGVVNGSSDASVDILRKYRQRYPGQIDYVDIAAPGRGQALKEYWRRSRADILAYMDCDLAVSLENISDLINPLLAGEADITIGSRLSAGSAIKRSWLRELISRGYNRLSKFLLGHEITDLQCGFKAIRREAFIDIGPYIYDDFWFFDTELILLADRLGYTIKQIPVDWQENRFLVRPTTVKIFRDSCNFFKNTLTFRRRLKRWDPVFQEFRRNHRMSR